MRGVLDTLPEGRRTSLVKEASQAKVSVTLARHTGQDPNLARTKQAYRAAPSTGPYIIELIAKGRAAQAGQAERPAEPEERVTYTEAEIDHIEEELAVSKPLPQKREPEVAWVSSPSTLTHARFKNLVVKKLARSLDTDLPGSVQHSCLRRGSNTCLPSSSYMPRWASRNLLFLKSVVTMKFGHTYARLKGFGVATKKKIEDLETQLSEMNKYLFAANNQVKELKQHIEDTPSTTKLEKDLEE
uniref:Uncharacterized protein n=1 Tax=Cannabis sativa TaxID=3483 RepID=A0A803PR32_CANSA